jgi:hypothetical protein
VKFYSDSGNNKFLGNEQIGNFICEKSEIKNGDSVYTVWESPELRFPIKILQNHGNVTTTLTNISLQTIPESFFTIPDDYIIMLDRWRP